MNTCNTCNVCGNPTKDTKLGLMAVCMTCGHIQRSDAGVRYDKAKAEFIAALKRAFRIGGER